MGNFALTHLRILGLSLPHTTSSNPIHPGLALLMSVGFSIPNVTKAELLDIH